ncbi:MAG: DUF1206 domain-containing protein [Phycisphaerales bacterium]
MANHAATAHRQARAHAPELLNTPLWPDWVVRLGYISKGVVYSTVGVLAIMAATGGGGGGETGGSRNAIQELLEMSFGFPLVVVLAVGLGCYALWRWTQTFADPENQASGDAKGYARRVVYFVSAVIYTGLTIWTVKLLMGSGSSSSGGDRSEAWSAQLMGETWGRWLLGAVAVMIIVGGFMEAGKAITQSYQKKLKLAQVDETPRKAIKFSATLGLAARGVVFFIIGGSLLYTTITQDPDEAKSFGEALASLRDQPYGTWLYGAVAFGVLAYGVYQVVKGFYRKIEA